jgi:hypothetical protein
MAQLSKTDLYADIPQHVWDYRFAGPFSWLVSGSSGAGKSYMLSEFIKHHKRLIVPRQKKLLVAYRHIQPLYHDFSKYIETEFMKEPNLIPNPDSELNNATILLIDDLMNSMQQCIDYFTIHSHHKNICVIFVTQNLYASGLRTLSLNANYLTIYRNPRDSSQIRFLARQLEPDDSQLVIKAYEMATKNAHGYLHVNCMQKCNPIFKYRDKIDANDFCSIFISKKNKFQIILFDKLMTMIKSGIPIRKAIKLLLYKQQMVISSTN